jgi:predicted RNase H-like nuclease (RuvC/YqgF family)
MGRNVEDVKRGIFGAEVPAYAKDAKRRSAEEIENEELKKEIRELKAKIQELSSENDMLAKKLGELGASSGKKPERKWFDVLKL